MLFVHKSKSGSWEVVPRICFLNSMENQHRKGVAGGETEILVAELYCFIIFGQDCPRQIKGHIGHAEEGCVYNNLHSFSLVLLHLTKISKADHAKI